MKAGFVYCSPAQPQGAGLRAMHRAGAARMAHAQAQLDSFRDGIMKQDSIRPCKWGVNG